MKVVRLSALHTSRLNHQEIFLVLISVRAILCLKKLRNQTIFNINTHFMIRTTYVEFQTSTTIIPQGKNTRVLQQILSTAKSINNAAVLHKVTSSLVTQVRKADEGHIEQLSLVLNSESVTVHLTTYLNKYTMLLSPS